MTTPTRPNAGPYADHQNRPPTRTRRLLNLVLILVVVASTCLWAGAVIWGWATDPKPVNWLENREFPEAAEPICAAAVAEIKTFPKAHESKTPTERAAVIRQTTGVLETMIADLREIVPDDADAKWISMWLDDYGIHLADRLDYAERLDGPDGAKEEFFETPKADKQISVSLNEFAKQNQMASCVTPGDV